MKFLQKIFFIDSPKNNFILLILTIFLSEVFLTLLLNLVGLTNNLQKLFFNSVGLIILIAPLLYLFVLNPMSRNISKQKIIKKQLDESQLRFQNLYDENPSIFFTISPEGMIFSVNKFGAKYLGYEIDEVIGQSVFDLSFEKDKKLISDKIEACIKMNLEINIPEIEIKKKSSSKIWGRIIMRPAADAFGNFVIHAVCEDITLRKEIEEELITAKEKAEEIVKLKSSILDNLSHEFRTPLNNIIGISQLILLSLKNDENKDLLTKVFHSGKRLLNTLDSIYILSQINSNSIKIDLKECDLISICKKSIEDFKSDALRKNIYLNFSTEFKNLKVKLDEELFSRALRNIINNAIIFTEQGEISVKIQKEKVGQKNNGIIFIKDSGIGIPENQLEIIFQEFRQASEGINRNFEGAGLGLSISKKIIEQLNGSISVQSIEGSGTTFTISLPIYEV